MLFWSAISALLRENIGSPLFHPEKTKSNFLVLLGNRMKYMCEPHKLTLSTYANPRVLKKMMVSCRFISTMA